MDEDEEVVEVLCGVAVSSKVGQRRKGCRVSGKALCSKPRTSEAKQADEGGELPRREGSGSETLRKRGAPSTFSLTTVCQRNRARTKTVLDNT